MQGDLKSIFQSFANGKSEMESKQFSKLVKECKLLDKKFTNNDVDIVFAKVKVKGLKTITFADFERALAEIAKKKVQPKMLLPLQFKNMEQPHIKEQKLIMLNSMMIKTFILVFMQEEAHLLLMLEEVEWLVIFHKLATDQLLMLEVLSKKNKYKKYNLNFI